MFCESYDPDNVFRRFKLLEFPTSFVGLSTALELDVEMDITGSAYLKTMYRGSLMKFDEARELSAAHRAFTITVLNNHTLKITFKPINECISKVKRQAKVFENRFVFDLRLIKVSGLRCCDNEYHSEVGRYYLSGQYEYCTVAHTPEIVNFGEVVMKRTVSRTIRIRNESSIMSVKMSYVKVTGYEVTPQEFFIPPKSSKRVVITLRPNCLNAGTTLAFHMRNPHDTFEGPITPLTDVNYLTYSIVVQAKVVFNGKIKEVTVESLHNIHEPHPNNTYLGKELTIRNERNELANEFLRFAKSMHVKKVCKERFCTGTVRCYSHISLEKDPRKTGLNFCKEFPAKAQAPDLFDIRFSPLLIDFGRVALETYGEQNLVVSNNTKYDIVIRFLEDKVVLYTQGKLATFTIKLKSKKSIPITILCLGYVAGNYDGTFEYVVDSKFYRKHAYTLQVGNPSLFLPETNIKFGMISSDGFVTSVPVKIYNYYNIPVDYQWAEINPEIPFEVIPCSGTVPQHDSRVCDITYISKVTKTKTHELDFFSKGGIVKVTPVEVNVLTRKLSIKFLQNLVVFKDIPINLESIENVKLENSSKEIAIFYVIEPLLPGITIEPMIGIIRPKTVINFIISVQISCVIEFNLDMFVKINNKENVGLAITGNTIEPKLNISPKNIFMPRVPCGMITYVPVTLQNTGTVKSEIEVLDTGDENIFNVFIPHGNEKQRVSKLTVEGGQNKTVFIKVSDIFRREYDMFVPFKINGLLGPPNNDSNSTELQYYIRQYEKLYESTLKAKVKVVNKDISYCRITGVITVPWIKLSVDKFEIDYVPNGNNTIEFTMTNVSKYYLHICVQTSKLYPHFSLDLTTEENQSIINENNIKFELERGVTAKFCLQFHPKGLGKYVSVATLFLDKALSIPYSNLTFIGRRQTPEMTANIYRIIFPPLHVGTILSKTITLKYAEEADLNSFTCSSKEESRIKVEFVDWMPLTEDGQYKTLITVRITVCSQASYSRNLALVFHHEGGSSCDIEVNFCFTHCPLTLHTFAVVIPEEHPYPYYPLSTQVELYEYMETSRHFLERWMFQQGFRRDLYPEIPHTFHAISSAMSSAPGKTKGVNISYLNFMRRIAGPLLKHIHKVTIHSVEEPLKSIKETHDTYRQIIHLMRSRGANLWLLQARFLLTHDQFVLLSRSEPSKYNADISFTEQLINDKKLFNRLTKQSWFDIILQSYKVFVMDSCFFDCICVSSQPRDIVKILVEWYNEQIVIGKFKVVGRKLGKDKTPNHIENLTTDLKDGVAIISAIANHCPFLEEHFSIMCQVDENDPTCGIVNNGCLIIEALNVLRLYFPLTSKDLLEPNFIQMLFLSIHLYVALPMYKTKATVEFNPPLLRSSSRQLIINPMSQETLMFNFIILGNNKNSFYVEKTPSADNGKKMYLSVKYFANFVSKHTAILLVHGYNKTRIFDTFNIFELVGNVGALNPLRKCKLTAPLYRPNKVDVMVYSPFPTTDIFKVLITDNEPTIPLEFEKPVKKGFYVRRLNLIDTEIMLTGIQKEATDILEHKLFLQMYCLSSQVENSWIWFRSELGEFFIKVTTHPRSDFALETLQVRVDSWPVNPCSCGEACECYRTSVLMIPHRNELMLKSLRYAVLEHASDVMMRIYDQLIESTTGQIILTMLLAEGGTNMTEVKHILRPENAYRIASRTLMPRMERVTFKQHTDAVLALPITIPPYEKTEKFSVTFTSECGMDIRTYKIIFIEVNEGSKYKLAM